VLLGRKSDRTESFTFSRASSLAGYCSLSEKDGQTWLSQLPWNILVITFEESFLKVFIWNGIFKLLFGTFQDLLLEFMFYNKFIDLFNFIIRGSIVCLLQLGQADRFPNNLANVSWCIYYCLYVSNKWKKNSNSKRHILQ